MNRGCSIVGASDFTEVSGRASRQDVVADPGADKAGAEFTPAR